VSAPTGAPQPPGQLTYTYTERFSLRSMVHPNHQAIGGHRTHKRQRYHGQRISVVLIEGYPYLVPFVESAAEIFLKTIIPSRKASRQYLGESDEQT